MRLRQVEREDTALSSRAGQPNFPAEQPRDFPANRQAKARPAIFAAGAAIGLLEGFKDELLFLRRDADSRVTDRERDHRTRMVEHFLARTPTFGHWGKAQDDAAVFGKFEGVGKQVANDLLQPLR